MTKIRIIGLIILGEFFLQPLLAHGPEPDSVYLNENSRPSDKVPEKADGGSLFIGHGFLTESISEYFTNPFFIGASGEMYRRRFIFQIDSYIGFGKTREKMVFKDFSEWGKRKGAYYFMADFNIGYSVYDRTNILIVPVAGIGCNMISSTFLKASANSKNEPVIPYYKIGFFIDIKPIVLVKNPKYINPNVVYTSFRLSFGVNSPIGKPKYPEFYHGTMLYMSIGLGFCSRQDEKNK